MRKWQFYYIIFFLTGVLSCKVQNQNGSQNLNLSGQGITTIPPMILKSKSLKRLDLGPKGFMAYGEFSVIPDSPNQITMIPEEIGNMKKLVFLDLSFNKISCLPESFAKLKNLESLDLSFNYEINISDEKRKFYDMRSLKYLSIMGTRFDSSDLVDLRRHLGESVKIVTRLKDLSN